MRNLLTVTSIVVLLATLSGCGMIPFKESTNTKAGGMSTSHQASFELRDERIRTVGSKDCNPKKHKDVLVLLSLSGGGSRAALLSGLSMIEMRNIKPSKAGSLQNNNSLQNNERINVLSEVDLISSVSGGSLAAGYYAISDDDPDDPDNPKADSECSGDSGRKWNKNEVASQMSNNYLGRWIGNWFWPDNILLYWFTTYDRTDIMAQTFADNLFDTNWAGKDLRISMLNPARPNIVINSTQGSENAKGTNGFGQPFTLTSEDFYNRVCSQIDDYELSRAVMASAAFPGVFNFMTLRNYCDDPKKKSYVHLFDGGNSDNLGLTSIKRAIWNLSNEGNNLENSKLAGYRKIVVIQIDAYTNSNGVSNTADDPRHWTDFIMDISSVITSSDSLLAKNRDNLLTQFRTSNLFPYKIEKGNLDKAEFKKKTKEVADECVAFFSWKLKEEAIKICASTNWDVVKNFLKSNGRLHFVHVSFEDITDGALKRQLNNIATNFKLDSDQDSSTKLTAKEAIECAVPLLFGKPSTECKYKDGNDKPLTPSIKSIEEWNKVYEILSEVESPPNQ